MFTFDMKYRCPICKRIFDGPLSPGELQKAEFFPFCSSRCKLIDLGEWLDAGYRIVSEPQPEVSNPPGTSADTCPDKRQATARQHDNCPKLEINNGDSGAVEKISSI